MSSTSTSAQGYQNITFCVTRRSSVSPSAVGNPLLNPIAVSSQVSDVGVGGVIAPNHVLLKVDRFGFSANNVTYGVLGEDPHFRYFDFHAAPNTTQTSPKTHGVIPVWGFATVVQSTHKDIAVGERIFGYMGMSRYLLLPVEDIVNKYNFYVPRPHLPADRRPYNQMTRCASDPLYDAQREDENMIFRPLFWTSFWCEDWLHSIGLMDSVDNILISSASAKTAYSLAFVLGLRRRYGTVALPKSEEWVKVEGKKGEPKPHLVGLTSKRNLEFTKSLGLYDQVLVYEDLEDLQREERAWVYVDVAGNYALNQRVVKHFGSNMVKGVSLGMSHPESTQSSTSESFANHNPRLEMFFMVEWLAERRKTTSVKEIARLQLGGWDALMRTCHQWMTIERVWWSGARGWLDSTKDVIEVYQECVNGEVGPDVGLILSMWEKDKSEGTTSSHPAKL
ncbi:hypothetical protein FRC14_003677 [Serendipita sp. 396]|nr:hypothetical protein FRC14_003677 [Serendipita sp. 396]KAG8783869.1 hypothetical protein FRC15_004374 [Serendipita sp. 397]KAG8799076.1 hypothetical protein FRC16_005869 [Serendipita sp. 398]KAG8822657.1 hypothetical protein FRC19_005493 [Serendipita sp. 401]KAG8833555.1 hypothetical protein FRC18_003438 [Serendipita sp. 400]KAG8850954.1 hypothetical protein FRB91_008667 [Serendipita sp. 411]KAG8867379.1 hypothetical protein FRC20_005922 [Serendipita sp. 405]KAG9054334.1 hypothetical prot